MATKKVAAKGKGKGAKGTKQEKDEKEEGTSLLDKIVKASGNKLAKIMDEVEDLTSGYIDTGSYLLNAQQSGTIYGGFPRTGISFVGGQKATGKTFILLRIMKLFMNANPTAIVILFESENATRRPDLIKRGIDVNRCRIMPVRTVQEVHFQVANIIEDYMKEKNRVPMMFVLDSSGMLSTTKEVEDIASGEEKTDMTKAKMLKALFRNMTIPLGAAGVPLLVAGHIYKDQSAANPKYAQWIMSGGEGQYYAASAVAFLTKAKDTEGDVHVGSIITSTAEKCRRAIEKTRVKLRVNFKKGLDRYYGLLDIAVELGIASKSEKKFLFEGHEKPYSEKTIYTYPKQFFTKEVLDRIDEYCREKFTYGSGNGTDETLESEATLEQAEKEREELAGGMDLSEFED